MPYENFKEPVEVPDEYVVSSGKTPQKTDNEVQYGGELSGQEVPEENVVPEKPIGQKDTSKEDWEANALLGGAIGGGLGATVGKITGGVSVAGDVKDLIKDQWLAREAENKALSKIKGNEAWSPGTNRWRASADEINEAKKAVIRNTKLGEKFANFTRGAGAAAPSAAPAAESGMMSWITKMAEKNPILTKAAPYLAKKASMVAMPAIGGALAGQQGLQGWEDLQKGDIAGAGLNAIGALSGLASMYPPAAPVAVPVSMGADLINYVRHDPELKKKILANTKPIEKKATGGLVYLADGGLAIRVR